LELDRARICLRSPTATARHTTSRGGLAIVRDAADFPRARGHRQRRNAQPAQRRDQSRARERAGPRDGRFLKSFLLNGFNMVGNRRAFDGMMCSSRPQAFCRSLQMGLGRIRAVPMLPPSPIRLSGVNDGPLTIARSPPSRGARRGPAEVLLVTSTTDYYSLRARSSHGRVPGPRISRCLPLCGCTTSPVGRM